MASVMNELQATIEAAELLVDFFEVGYNHLPQSERILTSTAEGLRSAEVIHSMGQTIHPHNVLMVEAFERSGENSDTISRSIKPEIKYERVGKICRIYLDMLRKLPCES